MPSQYLLFWSRLSLWCTHLHQIIPSLSPSPLCRGLFGCYPSPPWQIPWVHLVLWHLLGKPNRKLSSWWHGTSAIKILLYVWPHYHSMRRPALLERSPSMLHLPKLCRILNHGDKWMHWRHNFPQTPSEKSGHDRYHLTQRCLQQQLRMLKLGQNNYKKKASNISISEKTLSVNSNKRIY